MLTRLILAVSSATTEVFTQSLAATGASSSVFDSQVCGLPGVRT